MCHFISIILESRENPTVRLICIGDASFLLGREQDHAVYTPTVGGHCRLFINSDYSDEKFFKTIRKSSFINAV